MGGDVLPYLFSKWIGMHFEKIPSAFEKYFVFVIPTKNHEFSKGLTWLKCSHWLEGMFIFIKGMGHERHMVLLVGFFY